MKMNMLKVLFLAVIVTIFFGSTVFAQTSSNWNLPKINTDNIINNLPAPISDFVNNAKQIGTNIQTKSSNLQVSSLNPTNVFDGINNWFTGVTGISFTNAIKTIGNLMVWTLSSALNLLKWLLSFIK